MTTAKATLKKNYILDCAKGVFIDKGFAKVTMKDIVEACQISRGGLYRYYNSTKDIFLALFQRDAKEDMERLEFSLWEDLSAKEILKVYLNEQKNEMIGNTPTLSNAAYEFFLENPEDRVIIQWQFDGISEMIREVIEYGNKKGEFQINDPAAFARHITLFLNNMHLTAPLLNFPKQRIEEQFELLLKPCK